MCPADTFGGGRWRFLAVEPWQTLRNFTRCLGFKFPSSPLQRLSVPGQRTGRCEPLPRGQLTRIKLTRINREYAAARSARSTSSGRASRCVAARPVRNVVRLHRKQHLGRRASPLLGSLSLPRGPGAPGGRRLRGAVVGTGRPSFAEVRRRPSGFWPGMRAAAKLRRRTRRQADAPGREPGGSLSAPAPLVVPVRPPGRGDAADRAVVALLQEDGALGSGEHPGLPPLICH